MHHFESDGLHLAAFKIRLLFFTNFLGYSVTNWIDTNWDDQWPGLFLQMLVLHRKMGPK